MHHCVLIQRRFGKTADGLYCLTATHYRTAEDAGRLGWLSVSLALQFARKGRVTAVAALLEDSVEVFEVEATEGSKMVRSTLSALGLPRGILIVAVKRVDRIFIPGGGDRIEVGDQVVVVTKAKSASRLDDILDSW